MDSLMGVAQILGALGSIAVPIFIVVIKIAHSSFVRTNNEIKDELKDYKREMRDKHSEIYVRISNCESKQTENYEKLQELITAMKVDIATILERLPEKKK